MPNLTPFTRKAPRPVLTCSQCGTRSESIHNNPKAHNGWIFAPFQVCPECIAAVVPFEIAESTHAGKTIRTVIFK